MEGDFEVSKKVEFEYKNSDEHTRFNMKEFLPHTEHRHQYNVKSRRFMQSVERLKKRMNYGAKENIRIKLLGPKSFYGLDEYIQ